MSSLPIIQFDYDFSPYSHKTRHALLATSTPFKTCLQPPVLPRPDLTHLGISFRRMPVLSIGKDVFCDSALIMYTILSSATTPLPTQPYGYEKGLQSYADAVFQSVLPLVPGQLLTEGFVKDRASMFPILGRPDFQTLRPSALGELRANLKGIEEHMLQDSGPFLGGKKEVGADDLQLAWAVRWTVKNLGVESEPGFGSAAFPRFYKWIDACGALDEGMKRDEVSGEDAGKTILASEYSIKNHDVPADDPLGVKKGERVSVESADATPGSDPQVGKLIGTDVNRVSLELENGIHIHFPRVGYVVRKA
ncbi:MAG: hypothetical protein M1828_003630 [Chrysothrix sp. TS-e1954]|nr:MAG: hypothetical protein M1828_003630 [Chrysothrix sp. TS-e1954]